MQATRRILQRDAGRPGKLLPPEDQRDLFAGGREVREAGLRLVRRSQGQDTVMPLVTV
jgi:hypothetical protein